MPHPLGKHRDQGRPAWVGTAAMGWAHSGQSPAASEQGESDGAPASRWAAPEQSLTQMPQESPCQTHTVILGYRSVNGEQGAGIIPSHQDPLPLRDR